MSGIQEILVIVLIVLGILFIPRITGRSDAPRPAAVPRRRWLTGPTRLAIVVTILWPLGSALFFQPWQNRSPDFYLYGLGPVIVGWCIYWVTAGFVNKKRKRGMP